MGIITALTSQKKRLDRINLFLDGQYAFSLPISVAEQLRVGQQLSSAEIDQLQQDDLFVKAKEKTLFLLSYRPRSCAEIKYKLSAKYPEDLTERVIDHLVELEILDDLKFAQYWVEQRETFKPKSRIALQQELNQKGVDRSIIKQVLADVDEDAAAFKAANKQLHRWSQLPEPDFKKKVGQFLQRRGFNYEIIRETIPQLWQSLSPTDNDEVNKGD